MGATGLSAGSLALQGYATLLQSQGVANADEYQAGVQWVIRRRSDRCTETMIKSAG
jgi:hypothetical protein